MVYCTSLRQVTDVLQRNLQVHCQSWLTTQLWCWVLAKDNSWFCSEVWCYGIGVRLAKFRRMNLLPTWVSWNPQTSSYTMCTINLQVALAKKEERLLEGRALYVTNESFTRVFRGALRGTFLTRAQEIEAEDVKRLLLQVWIMWSTTFELPKPWLTYSSWSSWRHSWNSSSD